MRLISSVLLSLLFLVPMDGLCQKKKQISYPHFEGYEQLEPYNFHKDQREINISNESEEKLFEMGYIKLGTVEHEKILKKIWRKKEKDTLYCRDLFNEDNLNVDLTDRTLKEAAKHGGELIVLRLDNYYYGDLIEKKNKCIRGEYRLFYWFDQYNSYSWEWVCFQWNYIYGDACKVVTFATVWRYEPELAMEMKNAGMLMDAIRNNDVDWAKLIIEKEGIPKLMMPDEKSTPARLATHLGYLDVLEAVYSPERDEVHLDGLIHSAMVNNHDHLVPFFVSIGADLNKNDGPYGMTVLMRAAFMGQGDFVEALLQNGADPEMGAKKGIVLESGTKTKNWRAIEYAFLKRFRDPNPQSNKAFDLLKTAMGMPNYPYGSDDK